MNTETEEQITALHTLLEVAKREPEELAAIMPQLFSVLVQIYQGVFQWYLAIGAPGGESHEEFTMWLKSL